VGNIFIGKQLSVWWALLAAAFSCMGLLLASAMTREPPAVRDVSLPTTSGPG